MTSARVEMAARADAPDALDLALEQSHEVKAKVETCADELATANDNLKDEIAGGTSVLSAHETLLAGTTVESNWTLAVLFLDLDGFKEINDTHGHAAGDSVLKEVARRLSLRARDEDTVCRNGGDEFLYLLVNPQGRENIERIAALVSANIARPITVGSSQRVVNASIGVAVYPADGATGDELIKAADTAMYRAKRLGSGCVFFGNVE